MRAHSCRRCTRPRPAGGALVVADRGRARGWRRGSRHRLVHALAGQRAGRLQSVARCLSKAPASGPQVGGVVDQGRRGRPGCGGGQGAIPFRIWHRGGWQHHKGRGFGGGAAASLDRLWMLSMVSSLPVLRNISSACDTSLSSAMSISPELRLSGSILRVTARRGAAWGGPNRRRWAALPPLNAAPRDSGRLQHCQRGKGSAQGERGFRATDDAYRARRAPSRPGRQQPAPHAHTPTHLALSPLTPVLDCAIAATPRAWEWVRTRRRCRCRAGAGAAGPASRARGSVEGGVPVPPVHQVHVGQALR